MDSSKQEGSFSAIISDIPVMLRERAEFLSTVLERENQGSLILMMMTVITICFGFYAFALGLRSGVRQAACSAIKCPLVVFVTFTICLPALWAFSTFLGSQLSIVEIVLIAFYSFVIPSILIASLTLIILFYGLTTHYEFVKLLNVAFFILAGFIGITVLYSSLSVTWSSSESTVGSYMVLVLLFLLWSVLFGFVGLHVAWLMRPLIGDPTLPFQLFRRQSNREDPSMTVYTAIWRAIKATLSNGEGGKEGS